MGLMHAGNQVSKAEARVDCAARVFVDVYAKAVAEAAVNADCTKFSDNSIYSNVITEVTTNVDWTEFCDYDDSVVGSANVELYGDTYADAVRSVCCACCVRFQPCTCPAPPSGSGRRWYQRQHHRCRRCPAKRPTCACLETCATVARGVDMSECWIACRVSAAAVSMSTEAQRVP